MRITLAIFTVAIIAALWAPFSAGFAATTDENATNAYMLNTEQKDELIAFVNEAKDYVLEYGKDKAFKAFSDPNGLFVMGQHYIIAYDFNGTCLAHPYEPGMIGENVLNLTDINGVALKRNMREVAKRGSGFSYYIWANPSHSNAQELKITYELKVDEGLWLASGAYLPGETPVFSKESREDLVAFVQGAKDFYLNTTKGDALETFNDISSEFVNGNRYIAAYDFDGNLLAHPFRPEFIGKNRIEVKDINGVELVKDMMALAQSGGGFTYYFYADPAKNMTQGFKLAYVMKVDDTWWLGSGIYTS